MDETHGWAYGDERVAMAKVLEALGEQPEARHVAERADGRRPLPVRIWYVLPAGLLDARSTDDQQSVEAELTPWQEVTGVRVTGRSKGGRRAEIGLSIEVPSITVEPQPENVMGQFGTLEPNSSWAFVRAVLGKVGPAPR